MPVSRILAPVDFSEASRRGLAYAFNAAKAWDASIEVLHACSLPPYVPANVALSLVRGDASMTVEELAKSQATEQLEGLLASVPHEGIEPLALVEAAAPFDAIQVRSSLADLVVMGTHGRTGLDRLFLGSVAEKVVRSIDRPVLTIHRESSAVFPPKRILVGVDFSDGAKDALRMAAKIARRFGAELRLLHVIAGIPAIEGAEALMTPYYELARERAVDEMERFLDGEDLGEPQLAIDIGEPALLLLLEAQRIDAELIALGTRGRGHLSRLAMGSVAERVVRESSIPVLTLHHHP